MPRSPELSEPPPVAEGASPAGEAPEPTPKENPDETPDRRVWRNAAGLLIGGGIGDVIDIAVQAQIISVLGPAGYGNLSQARATVDVAEGFGAIGLNQVGPVVGTLHLARLGAFLGTYLTMRAAATVLALAVVMLIAPFLASDDHVVRLAALVMLWSPLLNMGHVAFLVQQANYRISWVPGTLSLLHVLILGAVVFFVPTIEAILLVAVAVRSVQATLMVILARRHFAFRWSFDMGILKDLLRNGLRGTWVEVVVLMYSRASYFVLDSLGSVALGIYALADKVTMPVLRISGPVSGTVLPMFAELAAKGDFKELRAFYLRVMRKLIGFVVVAAVVVNLAIPWIIRGWFPEYTASIPLIHVLFVGVCFMVSNQISVACLSGLGRFGLVAVIATINLCVYAVGAWLWVEPYRELGAALATTVMEGTNMLTQIVFVAVTIRKLERQALNRAT